MLISLVMKRITVINFEFVQAIPRKLEGETFYISTDYSTIVHSCCCGCGHEVVTPLSPTDWKLIFDGISISLSPSIGNWSLPCQSHYWIVENKVEWADQWSSKQIEAGRADNQQIKQDYYKRIHDIVNPKADQLQQSLWARVWNWINR